MSRVHHEVDDSILVCFYLNWYKVKKLSDYAVKEGYVFNGLCRYIYILCMLICSLVAIKLLNRFWLSSGVLIVRVA